MTKELLKGCRILMAGMLVLLPSVTGFCADSPAIAIKADRVFVGNGQVIEGGTVLIKEGRISEISRDAKLPKGTQVIQVPNGCVTPGLIDANARIESADLIDVTRKQDGSSGSAADGLAAARFLRLFEQSKAHSDHTATSDAIEHDSSHVGDDDGLPPTIPGVLPRAVVTEQSAEVVPHLRLVDTLDLRSRDFTRLVQGGVTTVYASPDASAAIGARGTILRTAGPRDKRVLVPSSAVKVTIGSDTWSLGSYNRPPSRRTASMYARRPNSRMGLIWILRKGFHDAQRQSEGLPVYGADTASPEAHAVLWDVLQRKIPLRIQARLQQDILAALRLAEEFDLRFTLEEGTEAYRCIDELKGAAVPVVFGPIYERPGGIRASSGEAERSRYYTMQALLAKGIPTALSAQEMRDEDGLARQAMYAQRFGVSFGEALRAVTQTPAQLLGLEDQIGTLEPGKRADVVLWSGVPFAATSQPLVVLIDGSIVFDRR